MRLPGIASLCAVLLATSCQDTSPDHCDTPACSADAGSTPSDAGAAVADGGAPKADGGSPDASVTCLPGTIDTHLTTVETQALAAAVDAFEAAHPGARVRLGGPAEAVTEIDGEFPVALDGSITDGCDRAVAALHAFFADNEALLRLPPGLRTKVCNHDAVTDAWIVRLEGGEYADGRALVSGPTELLIHVRGNGNVKYWRSTYLPSLDRPALTPCLDADGLAQAAVGTVLQYRQFRRCVPGDVGEVAVTQGDHFIARERAVFLDDDGQLHFVRLVDAFLVPAHQSDETLNSDLYCCGDGTTVDCVGKSLVIDELSGRVLAQYQRCITC